MQIIITSVNQKRIRFYMSAILIKCNFTTANRFHAQFREIEESFLWTMHELQPLFVWKALC